MKPPRASSAAGTLEISEDMEFQRRSWVAERVGQWLVAALVLAGLAGVFGGGPVSLAHPATANETLRVEYPRFTRNQSQYDLTIHVAPQVVQDGVIRLWVDADLLQALVVNELSPEPESVALGNQRHIYMFRVDERESLPPIVFHATSNAIGLERGAIGLVGGERLELQSFVYP